MKKMIAIALTLILCLSVLTGCGGGGSAPVTIVGTWEYADLDCAYTFNSDKTGSYRYGSMEMPFTYTDDGESVSILFDGNTVENVMKYSISGRTLSIEDSFGSIVKYQRVGGGGAAAAPDNGGDDGEDNGAASASYEWWEGSWYGWWCIKSGTGKYESATNVAWDAYAVIELESENIGTLELWDTGTSRYELLAKAQDLEFESASSSKGKFSTGNVTFFPDEVWNGGEYAERYYDEDGWDVDPADSSVSHFDDMIEIIGTYVSEESPDDSFEYYVYLRPWGAKWEDVRTGDTSGCLYSDMMPLYYEDWYLPLLEEGYTEALDSFDEGIQILNGDYDE